jgi:hypothetical protein
MKASRDDVLRYRVHTQQLDRAAGTDDDAAVLDLGVQDTGPDGSRWALAIRGTRIDEARLVTAWTLRGAPHVYRRTEAAKVAAAVAPMSEADARKRVFDASAPLKRAGIDVLDALDEIAGEMRDIVVKPTSKGDLSTALTPRMAEPYRRFCKPCNAIHLYEQTFRLSAIRAGLELQPDTSPPVLERIPRWRGPAAKIPLRLDPIRAVLHHLGPLTPKQVAAYIDAPVKDVSAHWPDDAVDVEVDGETRSALADDADALASPPDARDVVRLLGPFDPFLQCRDRELLVPDDARRKDIWRTLGRPGSVLVGHEIRGTWRPRMSGGKLRLAVDAWDSWPDLDEQAEALAAFRGVTFSGFVDP